MTQAPVRVVILGGGFGGLYTALELEKRLKTVSNVDITLVNRDNYILFTPMLHEVAASDLDITHIVNPVRKMLNRVRFFHGHIEAVDLEARTVEVCHGDEGHPHRLPFDHLVVALGSVTNDRGVPGLREHALGMKTLGDAIALRNRLIANLEAADFECAAGARGPLLTFVVAGGGFAGVETAAAAHDFLEDAVRHYRHLTKAALRLVLVHSGDHLLPELGPELGRYAEQCLVGRGIDVRLGARVARCTEQGVELAGGEFLPARTLVWTAGTAPNPLVESLSLEKERGRIRVGGDLECPGSPGVWALGDCAAIPDGAGGYHPPTAQHAIREARTLGANIAATIVGGPRRAFRFGGLGQLAAIGRRTGVAKVAGLRFSGFPAWWLWRTVYLMKLPRLEKKLRVMIDWTLDLLFSKDLVRVETGVDRFAAEPSTARGHSGERHTAVSR
jgi:NADH dehydrogenase